MKYKRVVQVSNDRWDVIYEKWWAPHVVKCWTVIDKKHGFTALMTDTWDEVIDLMLL